MGGFFLFHAVFSIVVGIGKRKIDELVTDLIQRTSSDGLTCFRETSSR